MSINVFQLYSLDDIGFYSEVNIIQWVDNILYFIVEI